MEDVVSILDLTGARAGRMAKSATLLALLFLTVFAGNAAAALPAPDPGPAISSDKADYTPGEHVTLLGSGWTPGETVHITVNDDTGSTWSRDADVTADDFGSVRDEFDLPNWFVANYSVTATGASGATAATSFTDGNLTFSAATADTVVPATWSVNYEKHTGSTTCGDSSPTPGTVAGGGNVGVGNNASVRPTGVVVPSGYVFNYWSATATSTTAVTGSALCTADAITPRTLYAHFKLSIQPTALNVANVAGTYGGTVNLSATLTSGASGVSGKTVDFKLNGTSVGSGTTNASGVATLSAVSLAGINAGSYTNGVTASFAGDSSYSSSNGSGSLTVAKANQSISFTAPSGVTYGDADSALGATASSGLAVSYASSTTSTCTIVSGKLHVVAAGTCTITASQDGNGNYNAATPVERTFTIAKASATVTITWATPQTYTSSTHPATATVDGVGGESNLSPAATLEYFSGSTAGTAGSGSATAPTNAGTYTCLVSTSPSPRDRSQSRMPS
jgi:hypothetical protein